MDYDYDYDCDYDCMFLIRAALYLIMYLIRVPSNNVTTLLGQVRYLIQPGLYLTPVHDS